MDAFLHIGSGGIRSTLKRLAGEPGLGTYGVLLDLEWSATRPDDFAGAKLVVAGTLGVSFHQGARRSVAQLQSLYAVAFPSRQQGTTQALVNMAANLLPAQLEVIEQERSGGPITLHLQLQGMIFRPESHVPNPAAPTTEGFWGELAYQVKASQWVEVLEHLRYAQGFLLQVPKFKGPASAKAVEASRDLEKAIADMAEGRFKDAVAACRDALEVAYGVSDKNLHPELGYKVENLKDAGKEARFWLIRQGLWSVTNAAKHKDEVTQAIQWERRDAAAVITLLSALLEQDPPL